MDYSSVKNAAIGLLSRREHSEHELRIKLKQKREADDATLDRLVEELKVLNYLSDERFAEMYVRARQNKGFGPDRILRDLQEKGVSPALATDAIQSVDTWLQTARQAWEKKFAHPPANFKERMKQLQFLRYRGHRQRDIERVLLSAVEEKENSWG